MHLPLAYLTASFLLTRPSLAYAPITWPTWPAGACTDRSFTFPSWIIFNTATSGPSRRAREVSFDVVNRANNSSATVLCGLSMEWRQCQTREDSGASSVDSFTVTARTHDANNITVRLSESWVCTDRNNTHPAPITFVGSAETTIPLSSGSATFAPLIVHASLQEPFPITPFYAEPELGLANCFGRSSPPSWTLQRIDYYNSTITLPYTGPARGLFISADVVSQQTGVWATCSIYLSSDPALLPSGPVSAACTEGYQDSGRPDSTSMSFDANTRQVAINQTWYCDDDEGLNPAAVTATAISAPLNLSCTTEPIVSSPVPWGALTTGSYTYCTSPDVTVSGSVTDQQPLPPFALVDPVPSWDGDGCTVDSFLPTSPVIFLEEINIGLDPAASNSTYANATRMADMFFITRGAGDFYYTVTNRVYATMGPNASEADTWYQCNTSSYTYPAPPVYCAFQYDHYSDRFAINLTWPCNDKDPKHPILFSANGKGVLNTYFNKTECVREENGQLPCQVAGPSTLDVTEVIWRMQS